MNFINRLKFYLVGFILGLFLVYSLFNDREWDWLPENKIKKFLLANPIKINIEKSEVLNLNESFSKKVFDVVINGNVLFSKSETKTDTKNYFLESKIDSLIDQQIKINEKKNSIGSTKENKRIKKEEPIREVKGFD